MLTRCKAEARKMRIKVTFETELPVTSQRPTNDEIADWLAWELEVSGRILGTNPFYRKPLVVDWESVDFEIVYGEPLDDTTTPDAIKQPE